MSRLRTSPRRFGAAAGVLAGGALLLALGGCQVKESSGDLVNGKKLFVSKCGSCHVLNRAGTKGRTGPDLDQAFVRALRDGFHRDTFRGVVERQILFPNRTGVMPAKLVRGDDAGDVAAYVAQTVAKPGKDTGALASAVATVKRLADAIEKNGTIQIDAFPDGQLLFVPRAASGKPGKVTLRSQNKSATPHDISLKGAGVDENGKVVTNGGVSTVSATVKPASTPSTARSRATRRPG